MLMKSDMLKKKKNSLGWVTLILIGDQGYPDIVRLFPVCSIYRPTIFTYAKHFRICNVISSNVLHFSPDGVTVQSRRDLFTIV